jgi:DNA-binding Lrp family transcriptional regulator
VRQLAADLDDIDRRIIAELTADGRVSMRTLAERLHISRANDPQAAGLGTSAYVTLTLRQADWREIRAQLQSLEGVAHIGLVGGEFDVILLVRARDNADLRRIVLDTIQSMPGVLSTRTHLVFEEPPVSASSRPGSASA